MENEKYYLIWERVANSGIMVFDELHPALDIAHDMIKHCKVTIIKGKQLFQNGKAN